MRLTTHRVIQLSQVSDSLQAISAQCERASTNAAGIRNFTMANRFMDRAQRARELNARVLKRMEGCPHRLAIPVQRRPGNVLNMEIGEPVVRCNRKSPDGRGLAWLLSGGDALSYGACFPRACPTM